MIYPYGMINGAYTLTDRQLIDVWNRICKLGFDKIVFDNARVKQADDFISFCKLPGNVVHFDIDYETDLPILIAWLNNFGPNFAFGHFCFLQDCNKIETAKETLEYWFCWKPDGEHALLDVILGRIPADNPKAVHFVEKLGFTNMGTVPLLAMGTAEKTGAVFLYLTNEEFQNGR